MPQAPLTLLMLVAVLFLLAAAQAVPARAEGPFPAFDDLPARAAPPDPLVMLDGSPVATPEDWHQRRRPELKALFQHYMYGNPPPPPDKLDATVERVDAGFLGGKATVREVTLRFGPPGTPPMHLLVIVPNRRQGPAPVFVGLNFCGNHTVVDDPGVRLPTSWVYDRCTGVVDNRATEAGRGAERDVWCVENSIDRGYAVATCYNGDIDPDLPDFGDGIHPHYLPPGQSQPAKHDWGTIAAWAWGLQRAVDYLAADDDIDARRIGVIGHSRLGKTALLAGALDERIAIVVPHQSGTGGCALSRDNDQETVERITRVFPHWFCDAFDDFGGNEDRLPIDQHLLMALVAPRALFDTEGDQDTWANFDNSWRSLQAADQVYRFLGLTGLKVGQPLRDNQPIDADSYGLLTQYRRDTSHVLNVDYWNKVLDYADYHYAR
jgi:hypothetical protein